MPTDRFTNLTLGTGLTGTDNADGSITIDATGGGSTFVGCRVYKGLDGTSQTINNNTATRIQFTQEDFDTDGFHDNSTNNTRLTVPTGLGGKYIVTFTMGSSPGTGAVTAGQRQHRVWKNGSSSLLGSDQRPSGSGIAGDACGTFVCELAAGDYVELEFWQNSGGTLLANGSTTNRHIATLTLIKVG